MVRGGARTHGVPFLLRLAACAAGLSTACGPILYTAQSLPATSALEEARDAGAERTAPYEFFLANAYLEKAREEAAQAHYEEADRFAGIAAEAAVKARTMARERRRESSR